VGFASKAINASHLMSPLKPTFLSPRIKWGYPDFQTGCEALAEHEELYVPPCVSTERNQLFEPGSSGPKPERMFAPNKLSFISPSYPIA